MTKRITSNPNFLECPISYELIEDPVTTSDKCTYEREYITDIINNRDKRSPMTREILDINILYPNHRLKKAIEYHRNLNASN